MSTKNERINKIKIFLRMQSDPVTVTEIHEAIFRRMNLDVSRKTIERDMLYMAEKGMVSVQGGVPSKYVLCKPAEIELVLRVEEIRAILEVMSSEGELYRKLAKFIE